MTRVASPFVQVIGHNVKTAPAAASTANRDLTHPPIVTRKEG